MKFLIFILSLLSFIVTAILLVIALASCAPDAHAQIRAEWHHIYGTDGLDPELLDTDGRRLYAATWAGVYISLDNGYTWRYTELAHGLERFYIIAIGMGPNAVYAGTQNHGVYRSDSHGNTWKPKRNGIHIFDLDEPDLEPHYAAVKQILVTRSGTVIAVGYHAGTYISTNRGETWHATDEWRYVRGHLGLDDVPIGYDIWSMTEFDGYWWAVTSSASFKLCRSSDDGETWEGLPYWEHGSIREYPHVTDWAVLDDRLYVAGAGGFGRWKEADLAWDDLSQGLPDAPFIQSLALNRGRIFAGLSKHGVYMFDERSETWIPAGLDGLTVTSLVSHQSYLYAATKEGIYRASISTVQPYGKSATTWGALKTE